MGGLVYGGRFEQQINHIHSAENIHETAKKFKELEKQHGSYSFGKFAKYLVPNEKDWADDKGSTGGHGSWEKHSGAIPEAMRHRITEVIATNLRAAHPLPLVLKVGENVDNTHDLHVKTFTYKGHMHLGLHVLCPNTSLK
jgi:hypothetical protein